MRYQLWLRPIIAVVLLTSGFAWMRVSDAASDTATITLAEPESFAAIADREKRLAAIFTELGKVLTHQRCVNCHWAGDRPRQGDQRRLHQPPVERGADGHGPASMRC